jgi:hypothetical protein
MCLAIYKRQIGNYRAFQKNLGGEKNQQLNFCSSVLLQLDLFFRNICRCTSSDERVREKEIQRKTTVKEGDMVKKVSRQ